MMRTNLLPMQTAAAYRNDDMEVLNFKIKMKLKLFKCGLITKEAFEAATDALFLEKEQKWLTALGAHAAA